MRTTKTTMRMRRANFNRSTQVNGLGELSEFKTQKDIDDRIAEIDRKVAEGKITVEAANNFKTVLNIRRRSLQGESTMPAEGTVKVTNNCIISRIGGDVHITFNNEVDSRVRTACELQGFVFSTDRSCNASFSTSRYIFALELCGGYEEVEKGLDVDAVKDVIERYMVANKVGFDNLSDDVKSAIEATKRIEILPAPDMPAVDASDLSYIPDFLKIIDDIVLGHNVFLVGPAGSGKTFLAEEVAKKLKRQYVTINCSQYTSPTEIKGGPTIEGYQEGGLIDCWENGKILILDELPKIDPNTAGLLNEALAKTKVKVGTSRAVIYNGKNEPKNKKEGFGVIATGNVFPTAESASYTANTRQDLSLLDRFSGSVYYIGFNEELEKMTAGWLIVYSVGMRLRQWILDNRVDSTISLRWIETAASVFKLEMDRVNGRRDDKIEPNQGKTLKDHVDAVISTFNNAQQVNLRDYLNYDRVFSSYQYRTMNDNALIQW